MCFWLSGLTTCRVVSNFFFHFRGKWEGVGFIFFEFLRRAEAAGGEESPFKRGLGTDILRSLFFLRTKARQIDFGVTWGGELDLRGAGGWFVEFGGWFGLDWI